MIPVAEPAPPQADGDRLNGWKEIATFLGKSVRTVQRWEREFGLPVHRLGANGGEIVFAWKGEISHWMRTAAQARANGETPLSTPEGVTAPTANGPTARAQQSSVAQATRTTGRRRQWRVAGLAALALAAVGAAFLLASHPRVIPAVDRQPADWRVADDRLTVLDANGNTLWSRHFDADLEEEAYAPPSLLDLHLAAPVRLEDLDGDGAREVLFAMKRPAVTRPALYVFDTNGRVRFSHEPPSNPLRFGSTDYAPEWLIMGTWLTTNSRNERSIWVLYYHKPYFPSLLVQLDARGAVRSEYVSNGYVRIVNEARWKGDDVVLVGAVNNETRGASLAVFEGGAVRGSAPAEDPTYRCGNCAPGGPDHFLVFPRNCVSTWPGNLIPLSLAWIDSNDTLWAVAQHDRFGPSSASEPAGEVHYQFDRNLGLLRVELGGRLAQRHKELEAAGQLDHALDADDAAKLLPVRIWRGTRFEDLPGAPVEIDR